MNNNNQQPPAGEESADAACSALPLPKALYSCKYCADEYSWPPDDLRWFQKVEGWVCENCWDEGDHGEPGIRLDKEIARQNAPALAQPDDHQQQDCSPFPWEPIPEWMFGKSAEARNALQNCGRVHPYTCGNNDCRKTTNQAPLRAVEDGWVCDHCGYTQSNTAIAVPGEESAETRLQPPAGALSAEVACSAEVAHGFMLPPGQDASSMPLWAEFSEYFERKEGFRPHPKDSGHKRLFEYYVEGAWRENQMGQNANNSTDRHESE